MNVIFITIDSLNRHFLKAYGQPIELDVQTPNLDRFAERSAVFERHYAGSLPCMPARREFFTGIQEFLWRPWGPMEPYDRPLARVARENGYVTQLVTDHYHYFQHGSHGYFTDYQGFEFIRGHETDAWKTAPIHPDPGLLRQTRAEDASPQGDFFNRRSAYARNAAQFHKEEDFLSPRVFTSAAQWLEDNHEQERFLLVIDSFDVHEPFHNPDEFASLYTDEDPHDPDLVLWPQYGNVLGDGPAQLSPRQVAFVRSQFAAKLSMVDKWLGRVFEKLDQHDLWDDTMVIVTSDHGHYLGEKGWMGKPDSPNYDVLTHTPLFVWHPQGTKSGGRVTALTSAVDLYATMIDAMGGAVEQPTHSRSVLPLVLGQSESIRNWAVYGYFGRSLNVTDGRYTYHLGADTDKPLNLYSTMFMNGVNWFSPIQVPENPEAGRFLPYTDSTVWRYPVRMRVPDRETLLFDTENDPWQNDNLAQREPFVEKRMRNLLQGALGELRAPEELYARFGLEAQHGEGEKGGRFV